MYFLFQLNRTLHDVYKDEPYISIILDRLNRHVLACFVTHKTVLYAVVQRNLKFGRSSKQPVHSVYVSCFSSCKPDIFLTFHTMNCRYI